MVHRRCARLLGDPDRADDATQEVFLRVVASAQRLDATHAASLLWQVATRVCLNRLRSQRRDRVALAGDLLTAIADLPDAAESLGARALLERLFQREPPSTRVMAVLHFVDGLTLEETAAEVGLSVSGVRKRLRGLKARLGALAPDEVAP